MLERLSEWLEDRFDLSDERLRGIARRSLIVLAGFAFVIASTLIVSFNDIFIAFDSVSSLEIGDVPQQDIVAVQSGTFVSEVLTEEERERRRQEIQPILDPPDPNVSIQQGQLTQDIVSFVDNVRRDTFATDEQKTGDIHEITALSLTDASIELLLRLDNDTWNAVKDETLNILARVMRQPITVPQLTTVQDQLLIQVSNRFNPQQRRLIVDILDDVLRANTFENLERTEEAREEAATNVEPQERTFKPGVIVAEAGVEIDALTLEALQALGLLTPDDLRTQQVLKSYLASSLVLVVLGLYIARFESHLIYHEPRRLVLLAGIFLVMLALTRILGVNGNIFLFPTATLALIYVAIATPQLAIIASLGLALLVGLMTNNSLEFVTLAATGNIIGVLSLRRTESLNNFFVAGTLIGLGNVAVITIFSLGTSSSDVFTSLATLIVVLLSGILLVPTASFVAMYALTVIFNLPTAFKLMDLSQPTKPLLQRLLREAPGTYQHSLQVANLAEQAASAIGADAQLTHVAALYHDIGKMENPVFFSENQQHVDNPHDTLNDPHRSADIIINHVIDGVELARQSRLPNRIRDFIWEHHGTTAVFVFYQRAIERANGDESAIDITEFSYPGPKPQSRETAILMLADSCESTVRAVTPQSKAEIKEIVHNIIEGKRNNGQLDESGLTLNDLKAIEDIFVDIFQGMFHPRIDYKKAVGTKRDSSPKPPNDTRTTSTIPIVKTTTTQQKVVETPSVSKPVRTDKAPTTSVTKSVENTEEPMPEVPRLPKAGERKQNNKLNGKDQPKPEEQPTDTSD